MLRSIVTASAVALAISMAGCGSLPSGSGSAGASAAEPPRPGQPPPNVLAAEVSWMKQLFEGTPVAIVAESDGAMRVDVPLDFSFDARSSSPKPPLRAVMDKVAQTLARQPSAKVHVGTPGPPARIAAMRKYLTQRGVIGLRVVGLSAPPGDAVTLRVVPGPIAIDRLEDQSLPAPTHAFPASRGKS
ncbi:MAG: hypothetical protein IT503_09330 [Burkholderiaceae bacterium]|nr:MAG: hypothetical protein F9K36_06400 [Burkholderiaceae bacterium]MBE7424931.1 hypothetical protein [Ideonella sp.]MCC7286372.1 hypothetical protein [Burkholderiaceae bacterium]